MDLHEETTGADYQIAQHLRMAQIAQHFKIAHVQHFKIAHVQHFKTAKHLKISKKTPQQLWSLAIAQFLTIAQRPCQASENLWKKPLRCCWQG